jgi:hypothetical protein
VSGTAERDTSMHLEYSFFPNLGAGFSIADNPNLFQLKLELAGG